MAEALFMDGAEMMACVGKMLGSGKKARLAVAYWGKGACKELRTSLWVALYQSEDWFTKARSYVEGFGSDWFILSAKHGLVRPDDVIAPYDQTLNSMGITERRDWTRLVEWQMDEHMPDAGRIVVLAGQRYREFLMDYLRRRADAVEVPMEGLGIGRQLQWLGGHRGHGPAG
jgi:hypothetical protein